MTTAVGEVLVFTRELMAHTATVYREQQLTFGTSLLKSLSPLEHVNYVNPYLHV